jgi:hypothetical protein
VSGNVFGESDVEIEEETAPVFGEMADTPGGPFTEDPI